MLIKIKSFKECRKIDYKLANISISFFTEVAGTVCNAEAVDDGAYVNRWGIPWYFIESNTILLAFNETGKMRKL